MSTQTQPQPKLGQIFSRAMSCSTCKSTSRTTHVFREMMFGRGDAFKYWECQNCGCLQIASVPENLGEFYPTDYYSLDLDLTATELMLYKLWFKFPQIGNLVRRFDPHFADGRFQAFLEAKPKPGARILDVGCGAGKLISVLNALGYCAHGVDPYAKYETDYIHRNTLDETAGEWDLIMFHHSLEHMTDNIDVLTTARQKLAPGGTCVVRIPIANWAWQHYRNDWVQLDAPRHLTIHTPESFQHAARAAGFRLKKTIYDSTAFQFAASEQYQQGVPLQKQSHSYTKGELRNFHMRALELNRKQLGDQAAFFLEAATQPGTSEHHDVQPHSAEMSLVSR